LIREGRTVAEDDLSAPLGQGKREKRRWTMPAVLPRAVAGLLALSIVVFLGWTLLNDAPFGGEPIATVPANLYADGAGSNPPKLGNARPSAASDAEHVDRADGPATAPRPEPTPDSNVITIIDGTSGKRQDVVIPRQSDDQSTPLEQRLAEPSRYGPLPRIAQDGTRPANAFARPAKAQPANAARIAIVVTGIGISVSNAANALAKLPPAVSLALTPYGSDLQRLAARARDGGHELLLQVAMEPFDYPENDPGPQTLLTSLAVGQNVDRLHWQMSRFQGYVGIANYMGARFTASEQALAPVLREAAQRGLIYVDDGSSPRSRASQIAGANNLLFAKADLVIDAVPTGADIDQALRRLETTARERGSAVGVANALPALIDRIAEWAKAAESRGVSLVPISAIAGRQLAEDGGQRTDNKRQTMDVRKQ
jgi:uncharacterized protein